jgi:hypothetical protein
MMCHATRDLPRREASRTMAETALNIVDVIPVGDASFRGIAKPPFR